MRLINFEPILKKPHVILLNLWHFKAKYYSKRIIYMQDYGSIIVRFCSMISGLVITNVTTTDLVVKFLEMLMCYPRVRARDSYGPICMIFTSMT